MAELFDLLLYYGTNIYKLDKFLKVISTVEISISTTKHYHDFPICCHS